MIEIDVRSLVPKEALTAISPTLLEIIVGDIAESARAKWVALAMEELTSSQQDYVNGISGVKKAQGVAWVELNGVWPNMIENGFGQFDMRDTLLNPSSPGVLVSKDGHRYRTIPFRLGGEGASGRNFKAITDLYAAELGQKRATQLGRAARRQLNKLGPGQALGAQHGGPRLQKGQLSPHGHPLAHAHKTGLFAGAKKGAGGTTTMRTISEGVPEGWIHPGYKPGTGADLASKVNQHVQRIAPGVFAAFFAGR